MKRLLIVDDEVLVRVGMRSLIPWEEHGFTVVGEASNGREAMEIIRRRRPNLVFTDLVMDEMDGFALIEQASREFPHIKFVVLSSYNDFDNVKRALKMGAVDYMFKLKITPEEVRRLLDEAFREPPPAETAPSKADMLVRNNLPAIKTCLLEKAIRRTFADAAELMAEFEAAGLRTDLTGNYAVMYLAIRDFDRVQRDAGISEPQRLKVSLENMLNEILGGAGEVFHYHGGALVVVFPAAEGDDHYGRVCGTIADKFGLISTYAERYLGVRVDAWVSRLCSGIRDLGEAVREAEKHMMRRFADGEPSLHFYTGDVRKETLDAQRYVLDHLHEDLNVARVARAVHMSESHFAHVFKRDAGMSFMRYVNAMRVARAKELLRKTDLRISEIAPMVGISNPNYFSTLFKKMTGKHPSQFRM